jgi:hypothetical protein
MTEKEQQIRVEILPQLNSLTNHLWDTNSTFARKLDKIAFELLDILDKEND